MTLTERYERIAQQISRHMGNKSPRTRAYRFWLHKWDFAVRRAAYRRIMACPSGGPGVVG